MTNPCLDYIVDYYKITNTQCNSDSRFIGQLDERLQNEFTKNLFQVIKSVQT